MKKNHSSRAKHEAKQGVRAIPCPEAAHQRRVSEVVYLTPRDARCYRDVRSTRCTITCKDKCKPG